MNKDKNTLSLWRKFPAEHGVVLLRPDQPDWIHLTDEAAKAVEKGDRRLLPLLAGEAPEPYQGRAEDLRLEHLKECWFHLTNRCNLACGHCLFKASPAHNEAIDRDLLDDLIDQAADLGCEVFYFTGGEPFVYEGFADIVERVVSAKSAHAVILSNGILAPDFLPRLEKLNKSLLHFQISLDGREENHDRLRGRGTFTSTLASIDQIVESGMAVTISVAVNRGNFHDLEFLVRLAAEHGCKNLHLLWHFVRGKGTDEQFVPPAEILPQLIKAQLVAESCGVSIDNVEGIKNQIFSPPSTRYDLSNSGWESLAVAPSGMVFPSPALVDMAGLSCGNATEGLEKIWRESPVLNEVRRASLADHPQTAADPWRFLIGGGDIDHSYVASGRLVGGDPYLPLYRDLARWLIDHAAVSYPLQPGGDIRLRMGDLRTNCPDGGRAVSLTHCNCVVSLAADQGRAEVREFYGSAARDTNEGIVNPFADGQEEADFIPGEAKKRSYGCGSPVEAARVKEGETVVDLGSGSGVECFMAAAKVGPRGRVIGIDMTDDMLALAERAKAEVVKNLGYEVVEFRKGFLEKIPLEDECADLVISNCVINLSPDKRATYFEVARVLKPGGRLVVSDVVSDGPIEVAIKNNEQFRGECLGGALQQPHLVNMLKNCGFTAVRLIKRFPYRKVENTDFYSLTYEAVKPKEAVARRAIYRGPHAGLLLDDGRVILKGETTEYKGPEDEDLFILDRNNRVENLDMGMSCCGIKPAPAAIMPLAAGADCCGEEDPHEGPCCGGENPAPIISIKPAPAARREQGCMVCGKEIVYASEERRVNCHYCGREEKSSALCAGGHFVCDDCHRRDGLAAIRIYCAESRGIDLIEMLKDIRQNPAIPMHGPEHHAMVPGIIVAAVCNSGADINRGAVMTAIDRGSKVPGGVCGFWGMCGAAAGVGIAFSVLLEATPLSPAARQKSQEITGRVLMKIAATEAGRCCQRESHIALREAAIIADEVLGVKINADAELECGQFRRNRECIGDRCHLFPTRQAVKQESGSANR